MKAKIFASLRYRNYRLWIIGQLLSLLGTSMQLSVLGFFGYELTHSANFLGLLGFVSGFPTCALLPYSGILADRYSRRYILIITQFVFIFLTACLIILTYTNMAQGSYLLLLAFLMGVCTAFEIPARQSFVVQLVPKELIGNSVGLNATMFHIAFSLGPAFGGFIYNHYSPSHYGATMCFVINAISYIIVIAAILMMGKIEDPTYNREINAMTLRMICCNIRDSFKVVAKDPLLRVLFLSISIAFSFGTPHSAMLPAWTINCLHGDAETNGYLRFFVGFGGMCASLLVAYFGDSRYRSVVLFFGSVILPLALMALFFTETVKIASLVCLLVGLSLTAVSNASLSIAQSYVPDDIRGRVMSVMSIALYGGPALCSFWAGYVVSYLGITSVFIVGPMFGLSCFLLMSMYYGKAAVKQL